MAVKSDNLAFGKNLFPLSLCLGEEQIFLASCYIFWECLTATVLSDVFGLTHAAFLVVAPKATALTPK